jgi:quercetin dioxygenase-like cupin family protein
MTVTHFFRVADSAIKPASAELLRQPATLANARVRVNAMGIAWAASLQSKLRSREEDAVEIVKSSDRTSRRGEAAYFTGTVWVDEIVVGKEPSKVRLFRVSFEPGARTAWHTHPVGQVLHVLTGSGLIQMEGQPARAILPGDTVIIEPGARHWHGAAPGNTMVHLALQEADAQGSTVTWLEKVTDEEYSGS